MRGTINELRMTIGHSEGAGFPLRVTTSPIEELFARAVLLAPYLGYDAPSSRQGAIIAIGDFVTGQELRIRKWVWTAVYVAGVAGWISERSVAALDQDVRYPDVLSLLTLHR
jgi:hypothetical protein